MIVKYVFSLTKIERSRGRRENKMDNRSEGPQADEVEVVFNSTHHPLPPPLLLSVMSSAPGKLSREEWRRNKDLEVSLNVLRARDGRESRREGEREEGPA